AHAVDHRVVDLAEDDAPVAAPAVDLVQLPERTLAMERLREETAHQVHELGVLARRTERVPEHVMADVEVRVRLPGRGREVQRHRDGPLGVARDEMHARGQVRSQAVAGGRALDRAYAPPGGRRTGPHRFAE